MIIVIIIVIIILIIIINVIIIVFVQGAAGPNSTTCQIEFNALTCAGSCACAPPPPAPPIAAAPGCGYNASLFSQQSIPPTGCTCCDAGFDYQDSCATQVSTPFTNTDKT